MCSTGLLLWRNQKGSTRYPMILYKRDSTGDNFFLNIQIFFGQAVSKNSSKPLILKGFYSLRVSNDYCFRSAAQGKLSQRYRRNTAAVLRAVVKSHYRLKGTKIFACGCSGRNLKSFSKFAGKSPCWGLLF